jgi:hypothetical protein
MPPRDLARREGRVRLSAAVFACNRTGDTILDTKSVRDSLLAAMQRSNPDSSPNSMQRKEIGGLFFQHVDSVTGDTSYYFKAAPSYVTQSACGNEWNVFSGNNSVDTPVGAFHTHPHLPGDTVYGCRQANAQQVPGGPGIPRIAGDERRTGGGSDDDWAMTLNAAWPIPQYVMAKSGLIARLNYGTPGNARRQNPNLWYWRSNPSGCRGW